MLDATGIFFPGSNRGIFRVIFCHKKTLTRSAEELLGSEYKFVISKTLIHVIDKYEMLNKNCIDNSLIDLMLIAMYEDEHEFDYEILRVYVAEHISPYKKAWAELASKFFSLNM